MQKPQQRGSAPTYLGRLGFAERRTTLGKPVKLDSSLHVLALPENA